MIAEPCWVRSSLVQAFVDRIDIIVDRGQVALWLMGEHDESKPGARASAESAGLLLTLTVPARLRRVGKEMRIVLEDGSDSAAPDPSLLRLLIRANAIRDRLFADRSLTLEEIAKEEKMVASYATRLFRLTLLARYWPPILSARSSTATSRRGSRHERSWTTRGCRLTGASSGGPSASPEASARFSQRIVRLYPVPFSLFILARSPEIRPLTQRPPYHQNPRTRL
jgi:hypothetical protein